MAEYETVIGLEVHVQLKTKSKLFCGCSTEFGAPPNTHTCPVCTGMPGVLPVVNRQAVEYAIKSALALNCEVPSRSIFARKNYFYPDLPKNYQISQYEQPLAQNGYLEIGTDSAKKRVGIARINLEEDAGKLLHNIGSREIDGSLVDFNRCGVPLLEIVSSPDIKSPEEAYTYLTTLKNILRYLEVSDCDMEKGSLRCDANVSVRLVGKKELGVKAEVKNMNSFRAIQKALEYEVTRQIKALESEERIVQETRLWDEKKERTYSMRSKEEAHDYRYFPEPDLVPLVAEKKRIENIRKTISELPDMRRQRFIKEYKLSQYDAGVLTSDKALADYFEQVVKSYNNPKMVTNWVMVELLGRLNTVNKQVRESPVSPGQLADLLKLMDKGIISGKIAKTVFEEMFNTGKNPQAIVQEQKLVQITDEKEISRIVEEVLKENPDAVEEYGKGKQKAIGHLVGQVMRKTQGKANPQLVNKILKERLLKK
ncbi:Asp-tRNA(Asn)/Glu-tRNA(Gln) amidotransferase subunit GatB [bacterium]|nr:Asp-tRNA(Asn)/Glu-tRNA(Gln) amidotransferase subunit GatB [bacterium]NIN93211.1 Asp-tRNA(Asn)/Glu-tRNA(Gln) amidotransferase subunit GatB [bacterium]NIO19008.1 Asp-tRNA(Asn)/Glu-tRNA(Gln) amidotransferase subunit GatB [bacterium]NIO74137.1 Asp-tRNA(Asn)/Glu-tRNA(Gln) amidotransferase subunit GatB [bacterium]